MKHPTAIPDAADDRETAEAGSTAAGSQTAVADPDEDVADADPVLPLFESPTLPDEALAAPAETLTEAPHDELAEAEPELSAEELARERELVAESAPPPFDIPMTTNDQVLAWVDYYANRHPASFRVGLERSGRYLDMFRDIFAEAGIPQDLVFMAHVESAYKTTAYSRAAAKGIFQFIAPTARRYGLRVDYWVDERSDPEKSARAAAAYLTDLHAEFGDWYLALAGYNAGEGRIRKGRRAGAEDFWQMADRRLLRRETRNYVPAILAATLISKDPERYGLDVDYEPPLEYETIVVEGAADLRVLGRCAGADLDTMRALNPALRRLQTPPGATTEVRVPVGTAETTLAALAEVPVTERVLYARHKVRSGDTLYDLARAYGVSVRAIQDTNHMGRRTTIRIGKELVIPTVAAGRFDGGGAPAGPAGDPFTYRVRRGDTLSGIAARHRTTAVAIASASGIRVNSTLRIGQRLSVVPGARSVAAARAAMTGESTVASNAGGDRRFHTVRRGDTLWRIAQRYGTTVDTLCSLNSISRSAPIHPGTRLAVVVH